MNQIATLKMWMRELEREHGGVRAAAGMYGMNPGNWVHLREGESKPEPATLEKLGLRVAAVLYEVAP